MKKLLFVVLLIGFYVHFYSFNPRQWHIPSFGVVSADRLPIMSPADAPYQNMILHPSEIGIRQGYYIKALATYSISARVLSVRDYSSSDQGDLIPLDIALGWKRMADPSIVNALNISQSDRWYEWRYEGTPPIPEREIETSSANTHIIPADDEIYRMLKNVSVGQIVSLRGYLVEASTDDGWRWRSSLTRSDVGQGSCELMFVKSVDVLN